MIRSLWATNSVFTNTVNNRLTLLCWKTMSWPYSSWATIFCATYLYLRDCFFPCTWVCGKKIVLCGRFFPSLIACFVCFFFTGPNFGYKSIETYWQVLESFLGNSADCVPWLSDRFKMLRRQLKFHLNYVFLCAGVSTTSWKCGIYY